MFVLDHSLRIVIAAAAVGVILIALRVRSGSARHAAWTAVLIAMLTMPVLTMVVPAIEVPVPSTLAPDLETIDRFTSEGNRSPEMRGNVHSAPRQMPSSAPTITTRAVLPAEPLQRFNWSLLLTAVYLLGLVFFATRLAAGLMMARRLARTAVATPLAARARVVESKAVAAPLTTGVLSPVIVLPTTWRDWPQETLRAALAHEDAHVARRDCLVLLLAQVNRTIFWFHPLAWWLTRALAVTAEHACDETVVRRIGEPRKYAEILIEMARSVSTHRSRIAWAAAGIDGAGHLGTRVDRLLRGDSLGRMSFARCVSLAAACAAVLIGAIACRQQIAAAPLRPDPEVAKRLADAAERTRMAEASRNMSEAEVDSLEARVTSNPEDWDARERLVIYYRQGTNVPWGRKVAGLRRHALWLIEHAPEHEIPAPALSPEYDPEGFAEATRLWDAQLGRRDASPFLLYRAAQFFAPYDKPRAEELILRGMELDPQSDALKRRMPPNVAGYSWPSQLSSLYVAALAGTRGTSSVEWSADAAHSPFAQEVRRKLDASRDASLLASVGGNLVRTARRRAPAPGIAALGRSYVDRATQLAPDSDTVRRVVASLAADERRQTISAAVRDGKAVDDDDRLEYLALKAMEAYSLAEFQTDYRKDAAASKQKLDEARKAAGEALAIADRVPHSPIRGSAVMTAHQTLALIALREAKRQEALEHMRQSVSVDTLDARLDLAVGLRLANYLLNIGERETVAEFFERYAQLAPWRKETLLREASAIRDGRMPETYQRMFAGPERTK